MEKVIVTKAKLDDIADTIRDKAGIDAKMTLDEMKIYIKTRMGTQMSGALIRTPYGCDNPTIGLCGTIELL